MDFNGIIMQVRGLERSRRERDEEGKREREGVCV
jgi:hypothetical protein